MSEEEPAYTPQERTDDPAGDQEETDQPRKTPQGRSDQVEDEHPPRD